ncbi:hypothetical protein GC175_32620, partial [bacterium]|nr:hypothetical protein [bacterium]
MHFKTTGNRYLIWKLCLIGCLFVLGWGAARPVTAQGPTLIGSVTINGNVSWTPENSPYIIQGNVSILDGGSLTILPGVEIRFDADRLLDVRGGGTLIAQGTETQPITFTANLTTPVAGHWRYLYFYAD